MPGQHGVEMGGTMRLGLWPCKLLPGSKAAKAYGTDLVEERHRHRFEVNNDYLPVLAEQGLIASGVSPDGKLVEIMELDGHPFFIGVQFHPEFKSRPNKPHPLFLGLIQAAKERHFARQAPEELEGAQRATQNGGQSAAQDASAVSPQQERYMVD
jgi:CTP synthase